MGIYSVFFFILDHSASRQQMKMVGVGGGSGGRGVINGVTEKGYGKKVGVVYGVVEKREQWGCCER